MCAVSSYPSEDMVFVFVLTQTQHRLKNAFKFCQSPSRNSACVEIE